LYESVRMQENAAVNRKSRDFIWGELLSFLEDTILRNNKGLFDAGSIIIFKTKYVPAFVYLD